MHCAPRLSSRLNASYSLRSGPRISLIQALHSSVLPALRGKAKASDAMLFLSFPICSVTQRRDAEQVDKTSVFAGSQGHRSPRARHSRPMLTHLSFLSFDELIDTLSVKTCGIGVMCSGLAHSQKHDPRQLFRRFTLQALRLFLSFRSRCP